MICTNPRHLYMELKDKKLESCKSKNCIYIGEVKEVYVYDTGRYTETTDI